ncbi:adenylosuccinate synthase, partial [filamentous cyanobacterium CCT1]
SYRTGGEETQQLPHDLIERSYSPTFKEFAGWTDPINEIKKYTEFPPQLHRYIEFIEKETKVPVNLISTGPDRTETVLKDFN